MKWKENVIIEEESSFIRLRLDKKQVEIQKDDRYLANLMIHGIHDEKRLTELVMEQEHTNDMEAGFILAQFLLKYQDFIEEDQGFYEIQP